VPKLWTETIEAHRREVRDAVIDTAATLIATDGLLSVTMSRIAEDAGIGRATLYKYFPDVESILVAWHERQVSAHLEHLVQVRDGVDDEDRLAAVLEAYARIAQESRRHDHDSELTALMHRDQHVHRAEHQLHAMFRDLLADAAGRGRVRDDVSPDELASYCLHALTAATELPSKAAVDRLVSLTLTALAP
jgi:AcrR family transcriptional regulator